MSNSDQQRESSVNDSVEGVSESKVAEVRKPKPFYIVMGDEQGTVLEKLKMMCGKALLSEPHRDRGKRHNWYLFRSGGSGGSRSSGGSGIGSFWWLGEGNSSLNHQFMIFKNPVIVIVVNYRYAEKAPIEKIRDIYDIIVRELIEGSGDRHPELRVMVVGYKFQKNLKSHRGYKKDILQWVLERQKEMDEPSFCDYVEDWDLVGT